MTPELWQRLKPLFHEALERESRDRAAFITDACGDDAELRENLARLVESAQESSRPFDGPLITFTLSVEPHFQPDEVVLDRFRIVRPIGSGGMGEVYEAWDSELKELVALKTIRPEIERDASVIEHFKEEVKQARQVAHPNICRVYDLFAHEELKEHAWFLTMQLLEGTTLQEQLRQEGPFSTSEALVLIEQMISGLAAAHELGVIHRDFKSSNVMLVPSPDKKTRAVITDFGLATRISVPSDPIRLKGQGTPAYVAPEQWHDGVVGPAADQYSLGVVICEMITGEHPIREGPGSNTPIRMPVGAKLPGRWERTIRRCLELRPEDRFGSVTDVLTALSPPRRQHSIGRSLTAALALLLMTAIVLVVVARANRKPIIRDLTQVTAGDALSASPSLSADSSMVAYTSDQQEQGQDPALENGTDIWVQRLVQHRPDGPPTRITNDAVENDSPSLSPDGRTVAFSSARGPLGIYLADSSGGGERLLIPEGREPRFSPDGKSILYWKGSDDDLRPTGSIYVFDLATQRSTRLAPGFADAHRPIWNSDGKHILFTGCASSPDSSCWDWWITSLDEPEPNGTKPRNTGAMAILRGGGAGGVKTEPVGSIGAWYGNTILFNGVQINRGGRHLWTLSVSPTDATAHGTPQELTPIDPREEEISSSLAANNVLALTELSSVVHIWRIDGAMPAERFPNAHQVTQDAEMDGGPFVSANGKWLTFARGLSNERQVWVVNTRTAEKRLFPTVGKDMRSPVIDDSATTLAYEAQDGDLRAVYLVRQEIGTPAPICTDCKSPTGWVKGSKGLLLTDAAASRVEIYWLATGQLQTILAKPGAHVTQATWSAANQFVLFTVTPEQRDDQGKDEARAQAFIARFPWGAEEPDSNWIPITGAGESIQVPRWSGDGKTIYYLSDRDHSCCLWAQHFDPLAGRLVGQPFSVQNFSGWKSSPYYISSFGLNLSVAGSSVYLNAADVRASIWIGQLDRATSPLLSDFFRLY